MTDEIMAMFEKASQPAQEVEVAQEDDVALETEAETEAEVEAKTETQEVDVQDESISPQEMRPKGARAGQEWDKRRATEQENADLRRCIEDLKRNQENLMEGLKLVAPKKEPVDPTPSQDTLLKQHGYDPDDLTPNERTLALDAVRSRQELNEIRQESNIRSIDKYIDVGTIEFAGDDVGAQAAVKQAIEFLVQDQEIAFTRSVQLNGQKATEAEIREAAEQSVKELALKYKNAGYNPATELARIAYDKFSIMGVCQTNDLKPEVKTGRLNQSNLERSRERAGKANIKTQPVSTVGTSEAKIIADTRLFYGLDAPMCG